MEIHKDILIEDLVSAFPEAVRYLRTHNIKCLQCGEPIWGTLAEAAKEKGFSDEDVERFVSDLIELADGKGPLG